MEVDKVADMVADKKRIKKKMADMELDKVASMEADMFQTKCIKPEIF